MCGGWAKNGQGTGYAVASLWPLKLRLPSKSRFACATEMTHVTTRELIACASGLSAVLFPVRAVI